MSTQVRPGDVEYEIEDDEPVSTAVVRAVAAVEGREPRSLRPLAEVVDPDALDALFERRGNGEARIGGRLAFAYSQTRVTVDNGEYLTLRPITIDPRSRGDDRSAARERRDGR